ncbi:MAG: lipopolysaccharide assembly protein LapA domain-containing protein [Rubripirellula sp.]
MQKIRWFFLILIAVMTLALVFQNQATVEIQLLFWKQSLPLSLLLISTTTIGFLLGALLTAAMLRKRKKKKQASKFPTTDPIDTPANTKSQRIGGRKQVKTPLETGSDE